MGSAACVRLLDLVIFKINAYERVLKPILAMLLLNSPLYENEYESQFVDNLSSF